MLIFLLLGLALMVDQDAQTSATSSITLSSPLEYQVFQRSHEFEGTFRLAGQISASSKAPSAVPATGRYRVLGKSLAGDLDETWNDIALDPSGSFDQTIPLDAGGWYRLEIESGGGDTFRVERFGIGEVFVGAGQSNSTNWGQFKTRQKSGMVSSFSGESWMLGDDPQPGTHDNSTGGSFWPAFGDAMYETYGVPIGVATTGHGGTSVDRWQPKGDLYPWLMTRIHQLGPNGFRALLWHQGESDVAKSSEEYYRKLRKIIESSKKDAGWDFPWFVAQVSYLNPTTPKVETTRRAQEKLWNDGVARRGPDTDLLDGDHRDFDGKGIHFSPKGLEAHGKMWVQCLEEFLESALEE